MALNPPRHVLTLSYIRRRTVVSRATVHRGGDTGKTITEVANRLEACMTMQRIMRHARFHYYYVIQYINIQKIRIPPPQGPHGFLLRMLSETGAES
jgi:hypothetical protein